MAAEPAPRVHPEAEEPLIGLGGGVVCPSCRVVRAGIEDDLYLFFEEVARSDAAIANTA